MYEVSQLMTTDVVLVHPETSIDAATKLMLDNHISGLPVVDHSQKLLGLISEVDIIDLVYTADIETSTVADIMTRDVCSLEAGASIDDAASIFCNKSIRRIPITREGVLVGVLSRRELIRFVREVRQRPSVS